MDRQEFSRQLNELQNQIFYAILSYDMYIALWPTEDIVHTINLYKGFFLPVSSALHQAMFMGFSRIFDTDNRTMSLMNLLRIAKTNQLEFTPNITVQELEDMTSQLLRHNDVLTKIKVLRDQKLAHLDANLQPTSPTTKAEISNLIEIICEIFNKLSIGHDRSQYAWEFQRKDSKTAAGEVIRILQENAKKPRE